MASIGMLESASPAALKPVTVKPSSATIDDP
jgi:hypothetical protein